MGYLKLGGLISIIVLVNIGVIIFSLSYKNKEDLKIKKELADKRKMEIIKFADNILYVKTVNGKHVSYVAYAIDVEFFEMTGIYILVKVEELTNNKELLKKKATKLVDDIPEVKEPIDQTEKRLTPKFPREPDWLKSKEETKK